MWSSDRSLQLETWNLCGTVWDTGKRFWQSSSQTLYQGVLHSTNQIATGGIKDIMKNARRKFEVPIPVAMPCKTQCEKNRDTCSVEKKCKTTYACIVEADESTRKRMEGSLHKYHEDHSAGKRTNSLSHYILVRKNFHEAMKIPDATAAVEKKKKNSRYNGMAADESQKQKKR